MFDWWWNLLYGIAQSINKCIDALYKIFLFLAGAAPADVNQEIAGSNDANLLVQIFTGSDVQIIFLGFLGIAAVVFCVSIILGLTRTEWVSKDNGEGKVKVLKQSLIGFCLVFLIPAIFSIAIWSVSIILSGVVQAMAGTQITEYSLAQQLYDICLPVNIENPEITSIPFDSDVNSFRSAGFDLQSFDWLIAYLGGIIILFIIGLAALNLVERIIDLVFLYIISPFMIAVSPLDEGNRLGIWKDLVIAKLLSVAGMLICFYIYFLCLPIVDSMLVADNFICRFIYLVFAIGGALAARKGGLLISNLVGHNTALIEGQQAGQTAQIVTSGFRAGLQVIGTLAGGAWHILRAGGGAIGGMISGSGDINLNAENDAVASMGASSESVSSIFNNSENTFSGLQNDSQAQAHTLNLTSEQMPQYGYEDIMQGGNVGSSSNGVPSQVIQQGQGFNTDTVQQSASNSPETPGTPSQVIQQGQGFDLGAIQQSEIATMPALEQASQQSPITMPEADTSLRRALQGGKSFNENNSEGDNKK